VSDARRRWTTEQQVLSELEALGDQSMRIAFTELPQALNEAAQAEATHKAMRARAILSARATTKASVAGAEVMAEADDDVSAAYFLRLTSAAQVDALREQLRSIRTNQDGLRTAAASHRSPFVGPGHQ
jgi:hypothetical protein